MSLPIELHGSCFCGSVLYEVTGKPKLSAYCHCTNCQRLTGCPFIHTVHYDGSAFRWTHSVPHDERLDVFIPPAKHWKKRARCKNCGCTVASYNSKTDHWSVWAPQLERCLDGRIKNWEVVKPTAHIFYDTRMIDINDELGKWDGYEDKSTRL